MQHRFRNTVFVVLASLLHSGAHSHSSCPETCPIKHAHSSHPHASGADSTAPKDSAPLPHVPDSVRALDSLRRIHANHLSLYRRFPRTADSLFHPFELNRHRLYPADALEFSEAMRALPAVVRVPFSIAGSPTRILPYGYTAPLARTGQGIASEALFARDEGSDRWSSNEFSGITLRGPHQLNYDRLPGNLVSPEMAIFWENGLFNGNTLGIRFSRPLSHRLSLAFFSNYRYLAGREYSHRNVDLLDVHRMVYRSLGLDSTTLALTGYNPLVNEHITGLGLTRPLSGGQAHLSYRYLDTDNHRLYAVGDSLRWENITRYGNTARAAVTGARIGPAHIDAGLRFSNDVIHTTALRARYPDNSLNRRGAGWKLHLEAHPWIPIASDTLMLSTDLFIGEKELFTDEEWSTRGGSASLRYARPMAMLGHHGLLSVKAGQAVASVDGTASGKWIGAAGLHFGNQTTAAHVFARRDAIPYDIPLNKAEAVAGPVLDTYESAGAEIFLSTQRAGVMVGLMQVSGVDSSSILHAWPGNLTPYTAPRWVATIAPSLGRWRGLGLSTRWMFSDERPYIKSQTDLSWLGSLRDGKLHIQTDLGLEYWSLRDPVDIDRFDLRRFWSTEILDLHLKTTIQIATFRMFYKIDNILNGRFAYVPGYFMPGVTFRWGISWIIPG